MNHFISGILKIILLEASVGLLFIDALAGNRFEKLRLRMHGVLAGLMVFAWANYGALRANINPTLVLTTVPIILLCGMAIGFAFAPDREARWKALSGPALGRFIGFATATIILTLATVLGWFPGTLASMWVLLGGLAVYFAGRSAQRLAGKPSPLVTHSKAIAIALCVVLSGTWVVGNAAQGKLPLIHQWEQYHFLLGAKYQRELGWFNLYKATIIADRETVNVLQTLPTTRDLTNFEQVPIDVALADASAVRARFSDQSWADFKADWVAMSRLWGINWTNVMNDHGNSNSPTWSILATPLARITPITLVGQAFLGWIDMLLMLGLWLAIWQCFGHRVASIGLLFWAVAPNVFDYLSGSFLRWDWLFALGLAACALKVKRYGLAGALFGFAISTKLFPIMFGVAIGLKALIEWYQTRTFDRRYVRFVVGTAIVGAITVVISTAMFGTDAWREYAQRIQVAQVEKFYAIQYSLKTVFLQHAASPIEQWGFTIFPSGLRQAENGIEISDYTVSWLLVRLLFTALIAVLIRRADDVEAFVLGPLLVFVWLTVNMYYWNMLGLLALGLAMRAERPNQKPAFAMLIGLHIAFIVYFLYQHLNRGFTEPYSVAWIFTAMIIGTAVWEWRTTRESPAQ